MFALKCFAQQMLTGLASWLGIHMCEYRACLVPLLSGTVLWYNALSYSYRQPTHEKYSSALFHAHNFDSQHQGPKICMK